MYKVTKHDRKSIKPLLVKRSMDAFKHRQIFEPQWKKNETTIYNALGLMDEDQRLGALSFEDMATFIESENSPGIGVNYAFKHYRFLHAQMSANPPTVIARPTSSDPDDKRRADAADRLCRYGMKEYELAEVTDIATSKTLLYGTGWIKTEYDKSKGDPIKYDEETGMLEMEGDFSAYSPSSWDVWVDPTAFVWTQVKWIIERCWYTKEEFVARWPDLASWFEPEKRSSVAMSYSSQTRQDMQEPVMQVFHYYEKGLVTNGMLGVYVPFLEDGRCLADPEANPNRFHRSPTKEEQEQIDRGEDPKLGPEVAVLPFHILTDIDVADQVYGKSFLEYEAPIQDTLNRLDSLTLDNVQSHGVVRIVLPEGTEIMDDSLTDTPYEVIKTSGSQKPHYFSPPSLMPEVNQLRDRLQGGGDDMAGVNDSMFGKQQRETSGFSMQYSTNQGNMIRRRLFNKYTSMVEGVYRNYLNIIKRHWKTAHTIQVLGSEKAYQVIDIKGSDISRGFDLDVDYGRAFSLDPTMRREEIMALTPAIKEAGISGKEVLKMLKLNDLEGMYDINDLAPLRQQEIFTQIIQGRGKIYVAPRDKQEHQGMLAYCYRYVMSSEYRDLKPEVQKLIDKHIEEREQMVAGGMAGEGAPAPAQQPGPAGEIGPMPEGGAAAPTPMSDGAPMPGL